MNKPSSIVEEQDEPARFTVEQYLSMADAGVFEDMVGKVELVEGIVVHMSPAHNPHFWYQRQLFLKLNAVFGEGKWIAGHEPTVRIGVRTVRDPDVAVVRPPVIAKRMIFEADQVLLVAEVSDATLSKDRRKKAEYARAMIPNYWIVDLNNQRVEIMSRPENGKYQEDGSVGFGEQIAVPGTNETISID